MSDARRCFMQWFVLLLGYALAGFFAFHYDMLQIIWKTDLTYMTSVIGGVFLTTTLYMGVVSWRYGTNPLPYTGKALQARAIKANAGVRFCAQVASMVVLIGMLGTVIGLMYQLKAMTALTDATQIVSFLAEVGKALGSAFYCTACGITASVAIKLMVANVDYFLDHEVE